MGPERLEELGPLWVAMHEHHASVAPEGLTDATVGFRSTKESWRRRRALYVSWFEADCATLHVALDGPDRVVGYAMVREGGGWSQVATPDRMAELESLSVLPEYRGQGIGSKLLAAVHVLLREKGIELVSLAVFAGNDDAQRLYERAGMRPFLTHMLGRVPPA